MKQDKETRNRYRQICPADFLQKYKSSKGRLVLSITGTGTIGPPKEKIIINFNLNLTSYTKMNLKWIMN